MERSRTQENPVTLTSADWETAKKWLSISLAFENPPGESPGFSPLPEKGAIVILHGYMLSKESMMPWAFLLAQGRSLGALVRSDAGPALGGSRFTRSDRGRHCAL